MGKEIAEPVGSDERTIRLVHKEAARRRFGQHHRLALLAREVEYVVMLHRNGEVDDGVLKFPTLFVDEEVYLTPTSDEFNNIMKDLKLRG